MTIEQIQQQLVQLQTRIEEQNQAIKSAQGVDRKEDLLMVRDTMLHEMVALVTQRSELEHAEADRIQNELQGIDSDFRVLKN